MSKSNYLQEPNGNTKGTRETGWQTHAHFVSAGTACEEPGEPKQQHDPSGGSAGDLHGLCLSTELQVVPVKGCNSIHQARRARCGFEPICRATSHPPPASNIITNPLNLHRARPWQRGTQRRPRCLPCRGQVPGTMRCQVSPSPSLALPGCSFQTPSAGNPLHCCRPGQLFPHGNRKINGPRAALASHAKALKQRGSSLI